MDSINILGISVLLFVILSTIAIPITFYYVRKQRKNRSALINDFKNFIQNIIKNIQTGDDLLVSIQKASNEAGNPIKESISKIIKGIHCDGKEAHLAFSEEEKSFNSNIPYSQEYEEFLYTISLYYTGKITEIDKCLDSIVKSLSLRAEYISIS